MAFSVFEAHEALPERNPVIAIYGDPGSGKTSLAFTADKAVLLDFDLGVDRCVGRGKNIRVETWEDVMELTAPGGYLATLGIHALITDTAGALLDEVMTDFAIRQNPRNGKPGGGLSIQGFGVVKELFSIFLRRLKQLGVTPVFICHVAEKGDGDERRMRPKMTGGSYDLLLAKADLVGYLEMRGSQRTLTFSPSARVVGKNCVEFPVLNIPHYDSPEFAGFFQSIIASTRERLAAMSEAQRAALEQVKAVQDSLLDCNDQLTLAAVKSEIDALPPLYQAQVLPTYYERFVAVWAPEHLGPATTLDDFNKLAELAKAFAKEKPLNDLRRAIVTKAAGLQFTFNRETGRFEAAAPAQAAELPEPGSTPAAAPSGTLESFIAEQAALESRPAATSQLPANLRAKAGVPARGAQMAASPGGKGTDDQIAA